MRKKKKHTDYKILRTIDEVKKLIRNCQKTGYASIDFETSSTEFYEDFHYPTILGISYQIGSAQVIPLLHKESPFSKDEVYEIFRLLNEGIFMNTKIVKIGQNIKFEWKWLFRYNCNMHGRVFDTMLAKYLLDEERPHDLKSLVKRWIPQYGGYEVALKGRDWAEIPLEELAQYNAIDCDSTFQLMIFLEPALIKKGFYSLFRNMLMMATRVLAESEYRGMHVDKPYLEQQCKEFEEKIKSVKESLRNHRVVRRYEKKQRKIILRNLIQTVKDEIKDLSLSDNKNKDRLIQNRINKIKNYLAGNFSKKEAEKMEGINFASPQQFANLLYTSKYGFRFKIPKYTKDKEKRPTNNPSTDEEALIMIKDSGKDKTGFLDLFLELRGLTKLYDTYLKGVRERLSTKNKVHAGFLLHGTVTGRLSCKNPNLQNIPRDNTAPMIKKMFVCPEEHILLEVDYGQAELRIAAETANDKALIDIFKRGYNVHLATACKINHCFERYDEIKSLLKDPNHPEFEFWEKQKKRGKVLNFSILYMQSDQQTAAQMKVTLEEAKRFKAEWFAQFPQIKRWITKLEKDLRANGYVKSMFGRKRRLPNIYSPVFGLQNAAIREGVNFPMQSGSSDFTLLSCIKIREAIINRTLKGIICQAYTVHDSIGFYILPRYIHHNTPIITEICENPETKKYFGFEMQKVKMKMSPEAGKNWGDKFDYNPTEDYTKLIS